MMRRTPVEELMRLVDILSYAILELDGSKETGDTVMDARHAVQVFAQNNLGTMEALDYALLIRLQADAKGPAPYATWQEAALAARMRAIQAEQKLRELQK